MRGDPIPPCLGGCLPFPVRTSSGLTKAVLPKNLRSTCVSTLTGGDEQTAVLSGLKIRQTLSGVLWVQLPSPPRHERTLPYAKQRRRDSTPTARVASRTTAHPVRIGKERSAAH